MLTKVLACLVMVGGVTAMAMAETHIARFADFDAKARAGERIEVVFLGGSLTWGANATDPPRTGYRGVVAKKFMDAYPETPFVFHDAAIGGTGSDLAVFRMDRDVLAREPDLVFLEFTVNDGPRSSDEAMLAAYEALIRRTVAEANAPVVQVIFPVRADVEEDSLEPLRRRADHLKIAEVYGNGVGDAVTYLRERVAAAEVEVGALWHEPDPTHPVDHGYALFAEAAWEGFQRAVREGRISRVPAEPMYATTYLTQVRARLSELDALPAGWSVEPPRRVSAFYDMLMSRWLDDVTVARADEEGAPVDTLRVHFRGSTVMVFGEGTVDSGRFRVRINGEWVMRHEQPRLFDAGELARGAGGNVRLFERLATNLPPGTDHLLEIEPMLGPGQVLRIESICVAGEGAGVWLPEVDP